MRVSLLIYFNVRGILVFNNYYSRIELEYSFVSYYSKSLISLFVFRIVLFNGYIKFSRYKYYDLNFR